MHKIVNYASGLFWAYDFIREYCRTNPSLHFTKNLEDHILIFKLKYLGSVLEDSWVRIPAWAIFFRQKKNDFSRMSSFQTA